MQQDYLRIARTFQATKSESDNTSLLGADKAELSRRKDTAEAGIPTPAPCEISELSEISPLFAGLDEAAVAKAYETKATVAGQKPPLQQIKELQAWLMAVDWRRGLRCGESGRQCKVCKGIPCRGSAEW